jgi:uncharacterized surface protein with fasciclin (FAS1) repeats
MKKSMILTLASLFALSMGSVAFADHHGEKKGEAMKAHDMHAKADIVDTAIKAGQFKTLAAALTAADLAKVLKGEGPFTVFAPTDEAFAKLPKGTVEALLKDKKKLSEILLYHVVKGKVPAEAVVKMKSAKTVAGPEVAIKVKDGMVYLNNAKVIKTDIMTTNGIIHVIDTVIMPPKK